MIIYFTASLIMLSHCTFHILNVWNNIFHVILKTCFQIFPLGSFVIIFFFLKDLCLNEHNIRRRKHQNTADLVYDLILEQSAQTWANYMASTGKFEHENQNTYGENLASRSSFPTPPTKEISIKSALIGWWVIIFCSFHM